MRELSGWEIEQVSGGLLMAPGGGFWLSWALGHFADFAVGQAAAGNVDYAGLVEQHGSNYNMLGA